MRKTAPCSALFETKNLHIVDIWDRLQCYQADFCFAQELPHYFTFEQWLRAKDVVDVGTGNGHYLGRLVDVFPNKNYVGVDHSEDFLKIAESRVTSHRISFIRQDVWSLSGTYDFAILRLVLQHVPDVAGVLNCLGRIVKPGGGALVVDAYDPLRFFSPSLPVFMDFFNAFRLQEQRAGPDKTITTDLQVLVQSHPDWNVAGATTMTIPSTIAGNMELFRKTYGLVVDLVELVGKVDFEFQRVREEWQWWCGLDDAYTHVGLNVVQLVRN